MSSVPAGSLSDLSSLPLSLPLDQVGQNDRNQVGGKAASLGEMIGALSQVGIRVPGGFSTTVRAFRTFLAESVPAEPDPTLHGSSHAEEALRLWDALRPRLSAGNTLEDALRLLFDAADESDPDAGGRAALARSLVTATPLPGILEAELEMGYRALEARYGEGTDTAIRSSATVEDSEIASFAGQYESYLNVRGLDAVFEHWRLCIASAFTERAISYQQNHGIDPLEGAVAVVVMKMVRSDLASSGVIFTLDPDSGNPNLIHVTSSYGLGEFVVQGTVTPDTFLLWKEGLRRGTDALVHRSLGAKDKKLVYSTQGGTATESVDVDASRRRAWSIPESDVLELGRMAVAIEAHYGRPMDIEWAKDGVTGELFVVQSRPETVHGAEGAGGPGSIRTWRMDESLTTRLAAEGKVLLRGLAVGTRIGAGRVRMYRDYEDVIVRKRALRERHGAGEDLSDLPPEDRVFDPGDVLVTSLTTPDWEPLMKQASLIITERGGRTSHAAIVAREFGIPAIVGASGAMEALRPLQPVTGSCADGEIGIVYEGIHPFEVEEIPLDAGSSALETGVKLNVGFPGKSPGDAMLPSDGVGLARIEFILTAQVGIHPLALVWYDELKTFVESGVVPEPLTPFRDALLAEDRFELGTLLGAVERRIPGYPSPADFFVDRLQSGIALICAAFHPRPVLVRLSDLKSNEYRDLLGGRLFEPHEENPMIGWRGAARFVDPRFAPAFELELKALARVRDRMGLDNLQIMIPFCRTPAEGEAVVDKLDAAGVGPGSGTPLFLMVEIPSNVLEAEDFIRRMRLTGGSIGSNDLVQTAYAVSRDDLEGYPFPPDARSPGVLRLIREAVATFRAHGLEIGICGQAPSDYPDEVPPFLVECGISSMSVTPDTVYRVRRAVQRAEAVRRGEGVRATE
jgi:pyruvate, water dikinase